MRPNYYQLQKQLEKKQASEWEAFHSFQQNILLLLLKRHRDEKRKYAAEVERINSLHELEITELEQAKLLTDTLLREKHQQERAELKRLRHH